jgi:hypothetical protein
LPSIWLPAPLERRADQRAIATFGHCCGSVEAKPHQAFAIGSIHLTRKSLPQHPWQTQRRALRLLQHLQGRDKPLFDLGEIAAERE